MNILSPSLSDKYKDKRSRFSSVNTLLNRKNCTHLGVGPMSKNCVDAAIELANTYKTPIMLIASRRQIECAELGGGYVNNWDTLTFAEYVQRLDYGKFIILARDHGGPWQHPLEIQRYPSIDQAMDSAMMSYERDLEAGFQILHLDPVIGKSNEEPSAEWILDKIFKLYTFCVNKARELNREVYFEIGTEEQRQNPLKDIRQLEFVLNKIQTFCETNNYPKPTFLVVQTGTKVMETRNIGMFPERAEDIPYYVEKSNLREFVQLCEKYGVMLKEHNTDYLSNESLSVHPHIGIHAANVAPEFGVVETRAILNTFQSNGLKKLEERFLEISYSSNKWDKWILDKNLSTREKAIISGHYVFSLPETNDLFDEARHSLKVKGIDFDSILKEEVKTAITRYLKAFNLI